MSKHVGNEVPGRENCSLIHMKKGNAGQTRNPSPFLLHDHDIGYPLSTDYEPTHLIPFRIMPIANVQGRSRIFSSNLQMRKLGLESDLPRVAQQKNTGPGLTPEQVTSVCVLLITTISPTLTKSLRSLERGEKKQE